ncbi:Glutamyl-tRNA(Gln) amidotransferase subunit A [Hartmannibacter diazotrophicus]|uniref:Glutamyl-tRNA(Gln) amidotransferase subunit A n=1 Tax=Hartmannibacter diazotrophicus TaxID=1482074 RepID=A0A2C9D5Y5_9HYPH|nr:amidase [Hartmannibacter diazotrophicus]SON55734.1 Glutamyl-tRNA(Gln) amidotransferase subunit A [Hartmannibacter diazotrophicus]
MLSVLDLVTRLDNGTLDLAGLYRQVAETIEAKEPEIEACAFIDWQRLKTPDNVHGPLRGLPYGVKDIFDTAEMPTTYGSPIYDGYRPKADASVVSMTARAGGVAVAKTRTTEFAFLQPTITRNPHNTAHTPGGSSSGSAAAVAAGMLPFAFGTQTAGSTIRPASFCGIAGFKPSYRILPTVGLKTFSWNLDTVGVFAASVADCAFVLSAISGREFHLGDADAAAPRVAVLRSGFSVEADAEMLGALDEAARIAEAAGATIVDFAFDPALIAADNAHPVIMNHEAALALAYEFDHHGDALSPRMREALAAGGAISVADYDAARSIAHRGRRRFDDIFEAFDVILCPSAPGAAPAGLEATGNPAFNRLFTLIGAPTVSVPGMHTSAGLPLGLQVVSRFGSDDMALRAAHWLELQMARK